MQSQLKDINLSISKLENENYENQVLINKLEGFIASAPDREKEWSVMTDEFKELKAQHDLLVAQDLQYTAELDPASNSKMNRYKIENPARMPVSPIRPKLILITLLSALTGLLIGGILAIVINARDGTFNNQFELEESFGLPVICSVPNLPLAEEIIKNRIRSALRSGLYLIWFSALCAALIILR